MIPRQHTLRAFSIVEVLVALAILVFGAVALYEQFLQSNHQGRSQFARMQARNLAHQELEQLRATPYQALKAWQHKPAPYPDFPKFVYQDQVTPHLDPLTHQPDGLLQLTVRIGWDIRLNEPRFEAGNSITVEGLKAP